MTFKVLYARFFVCENIKSLPNICNIVLGHGIDMVLLPQGGILKSMISI